MTACLIIPGIILISVIGIYVIIHLLKSRREKEFEKYFLTGEYNKTQEVYQQVTKGTGLPPLGLGLRQIIFLISQNANPEEIMALGKKIFRFHPEITYAHLKNSAIRMGVQEDERLSEYFRNIEFTYMAELISGAIPDYPSPEYVRSFINKRGIGIVLGSKFLDNASLQSRVIYRNANGSNIGVGLNVDQMIDPRVEVKVSNQKTSENKLDLKINIKFNPGKISTNTTDLISAFEMSIPEVHAFMNSLEAVSLEEVFRWNSLYLNKTFKTELNEELKKKYAQMISGMVLFIRERKLSNSINKIEITIHERIPLYWREALSKDHFIGNYVEHQFKVNTLNAFAVSSLNYNIPESLLIQNDWNYFKTIEKEIHPLISISS